MGKNSGIAWTNHTFNPWWGCKKVSQGCAQCYAETWAKRTGWHLWAADRRRFFGDAHWREPLAWDKAAERAGEKRMVFCASMADVLEDAPGLSLHRTRLFDLIELTQNLIWLMLTKRPENITAMTPGDWLYRPPANVWMGTTIENQDLAAQRLGALFSWRGRTFVSVEPMLTPVRLSQVELNDGWTADVLTGRHWARGWTDFQFGCRNVDWIIVGGESGPGARPMAIQWAVDLVNDCRSAGRPVFVKQLGGHPDKHDRLDEWPEELQVQELPYGF